MPNDALIERVLALRSDANPSERLILKLAAALIKQLDMENCDPFRETDHRLKVTSEEMEWVRGPIEVFDGFPCPKDWEIPERIAAAKREKAEVEQIQVELGVSYHDALDEYSRRRKRGREW